ncbi:MAG TPA: hypothetical protein V6D19_24400 [Stenomitos sp.]
MTKSGKGFQTNGNVTSPRHFVYLDRNRLFSYTAQIADGLPQVRRFLDEVAQTKVDTPPEYSRELTKSETINGNAEGSLGIAKVAAQKTSNRADKKHKKWSEPTSIYNSLQFLLEEKIEHDNLYIALEKDLLNLGLLKSISSIEEAKEHSGLIKITGFSRFVDWISIGNLFKENSLSQLVCAGMMANEASESEILAASIGMQAMGNIMKIVEVLAFDGITISINSHDINAVSSLNPEHLYVTREQLRVGYLMSNNPELTLIGFVPKRTDRNIQFPGIAEQFNIRDLLSNLLGEVDLAIDPLAIYG